MSRKNGTEVSFQEKFKDRMENIGKDGISGIMRNMENPINQNNDNNRVENWSNLYNQANKSNKKPDDAYSHISSISSKKMMKRDSPSNKSTQQSVSSRNTHNSILSSGAQAILSSRANLLNSITNPSLNNQINMNNPISNSNINYLGNNFNSNLNMIPNNYNLYNNINNNLNYNIPQNNPYNQFGYNDQQGLYNPYQYFQAPPINNINRNLINGSITPNQNFSHNQNYINYNNLNPVLNNNIGYPTPLYPFNNLPNNLNPLNQIDLMKNNMGINNQQSYNTNEKYSKRELDKMRSMSSKYRGDMSAINETSKYDNFSNASNIQNTSNTNNFNKRRGNSNTGSIVNGVYKPYSLEDYKKIANVKVELGSLGPNIGTKEWEERQEKMKKMEEYANKVKTNKMIFKLKKETPVELVEKEKYIKKENSNRNKAYKYDSLIREKLVKVNKNNENNNYEYNEENSKNVDVSGILNKYKENNDINYNPKGYEDNNNDFNGENNEKPFNRNRSSGRIRNVKSLNQNEDLKNENFINRNVKENIEDNNYNQYNKNLNDNVLSNNSNKKVKNFEFVEKRKILNQIEDNFDLDNNYNNNNFNNNNEYDNEYENNGNFKIKEVNNESEIEKIQKQRQALATKINEIKESFL